MGHGWMATKADAARVRAKMSRKNRRCGRAYSSNLRYLFMLVSESAPEPSKREYWNGAVIERAGNSTESLRLDAIKTL